MGCADVAIGDCREPNDDEKREQLLDVQIRSLRHDTLNMIPQCLEREASSAAGIRGPTVRIESTCPRVPDNKSKDPDLLCKSSVVLRTMANRYPSALSYVECQCRRCHSNATCEEIWQFVRILEKKRNSKCVDGKYPWHPTWERVSVGCICARER